MKEINIGNYFEKLFVIAEVSIENAPQKLGVDTIVNAANPTLMGSDQGVDGVIHRKVNFINGEEDFLKKEIKKQIDGYEDSLDDVVRCKRGKIVVTKGYGLCNNIFHTVGAKSDKDNMFLNSCSSTCIETLEECYMNITLQALKDPSIRKIAIPVISSGEYGVDFDLAFRVGLVTIYNTLLEQWQKDEEFFEYINLENVFFVTNKQEQYIKANEILASYKTIFCRGDRAVYRSSWESQKQFLKELYLYDRHKGYFAIARMIRIIMALLRMILFPAIHIKDVIGGKNWNRRKCTVEWIAFIQMLLPLLMLAILYTFHNRIAAMVVVVVMIYNLTDTTTYLFSLIIHADIQKPSANIIRSMLLLFVNFVEVSLELMVVCIVLCPELSSWYDALVFSFLGPEIGAEPFETHYGLLFLNAGIKFFFITMIFGYFANHLRQRKFRA